MVNLTIRNIPDEILKRIRILAAKERRSMNSEMLIVIEEGLSSKISFDSAATGTGFSGSSGNVPLLSCAGREKIWTELCGEWKDNRPTKDLVAEIALLRAGGGEGEALS